MRNAIVVAFACFYLCNRRRYIGVSENERRVLGLEAQTYAQAMRVGVRRLHFFGGVRCADEGKYVDKATLHQGSKL